MKRLTLLLALVTLSASEVSAQNWSVSGGTGPFVFGDFANRTLRLATDDGTAEHTITLTAATRPGLVVGLERELGERWAIRAQGTFTRAPLEVEVEDDDGVELESGDMDIATLALPVVFRINPRGTFRFIVFAGPAHAAYRLDEDASSAEGVPLFAGTRSTWGLIAGGGVAWHLSDRVAVEAMIDDTVTSSPFRRSDLSSNASGLEIPRTHNVHTSVGLRYRF
jgi:opacity protein-like surface antigen